MQLRGPHLTPGRRLREWVAFLLISALPTVAVSALALRALRGEEAAVRREMRLQLERAAQTAREAWERAAEAGPGDVPPVADAVTWRPTSGDRAASVDDVGCEDLAEALRGGDAASRSRLLERCPEHRTSTGRFLWPIVALAPDAQTPPEALATWLADHAESLASTERAAIRLELAQTSWLSDEARGRLVVALESTVSAEARGLAADHVPAGAPRKTVRWRDARSLGHLRRDGEGYVGFVAHPRSIDRAIADGWPSLPDGVEARLAFGPSPPPGGVELLPGGVHLTVGWRDPHAVERATERSRNLLVGGAVGAGLLALLLAALLWSRVRAERRLSALRTDFVAAVSHELRTPLSSIRMLAELLEADAVEPDERDEVHAGLAREARRLGETVERLLRFSRMEAGRDTAKRAMVPLHELLESAARRFADRFPEGDEVTVEAPDDLEAPLDAEGLGMALDNLLHNANKYAPDGTPYVLRASRRGNHVALEVIDHGPGVRRGDQRRIFRAFERVDDRLSEATEGTGIGLSLVQHVARSHGGSVELDSAPGQGACFRILLPIDPHAT